MKYIYSKYELIEYFQGTTVYIRFCGFTLYTDIPSDQVCLSCTSILVFFELFIDI